MSSSKLLLPLGLLLLLAVSAVSAKRCAPGCGATAEGKLKKGELQCKACKTGEYATAATNNCCTKCKGTLTFAGSVPTCTPRPRGRNSTDDNSHNSTSSTTCPAPFLTTTDPATGAKSCLCPAGTFLQPRSAAPGRKMLSLAVPAAAGSRQLLKRGEDDAPGTDDNPGRGGGSNSTTTPGTDDKGRGRGKDDAPGTDDNPGRGGGSNSTTTPGDDKGGKGRGMDDPLVPGDDIARRWTCAACPVAGQNPAPSVSTTCT